MLDFLDQNESIIIISMFLFNFLVIFLMIYCFFWVSSIKKKSELFFQGKNGKTLEDLVINNSKGIKEIDKEIQDLYNISNQVHKLSLRSIHKFGIIRFNPFGDIGGDQSFSIALLDGKNNGIVISSLHTKEGTRVYSKPILKGEAEKYPLTEEEKQVIRVAIQKKSNNV